MEWAGPVVRHVVISGSPISWTADPRPAGEVVVPAAATQRPVAVSYVSIGVRGSRRRGRCGGGQMEGQMEGQVERQRVSGVRDQRGGSEGMEDQCGGSEGMRGQWGGDGQSGGSFDVRVQ